MKESLYSPIKSPVFKETFTDEQATRSLGGTPVSVAYRNGIGSFDGTTSTISYGDRFNFTNKPFTIRVKLAPKTIGTGVNQYFISKYDAGTNARSWACAIDSTGAIAFRSSSNGTTVVAIITGTNVLTSADLNKMQDIVITRNGTAVKIYLNGVSQTVTGTCEANFLYNTSSMIIGGLYNLPTSGNNDMELVEIYDYTLTDQEVSNLANNRRYVSPKLNEILNVDGKNGTISNKYSNGSTIPTVIPTAVTVTKQDGIYGLDFNGSTSKIDCGSYNTLVGDKTFITWFKIRSKGTNIGSRFLDNGKLMFGVTQNDFRLFLYSNGLTATLSSGTEPVKYGTLFMAVVTRTSAGVTNLYINGVLSGTADQAGGTPEAGNTNITVGNKSDLSRPYDGTISGLRVVEGIINQEQISQLFSSERKFYSV